MSRRAVGDHAALGVLHSGGSSAAGTHQSRELITSTPRRRPAAGGARSWNHGPQGRVVEAGAPLGGASLPGNHPGAASPEGCAPLRHNHVWGHTARGTQRPGDSAPLSIAFSRQEYWSGLPFPSPGDLPDPSLTSPALTGRFFTTRATWEARPRVCQPEDDGNALALLGPVPHACHLSPSLILKTICEVIPSWFCKSGSGSSERSQLGSHS